MLDSTPLWANCNSRVTGRTSTSFITLRIDGESFVVEDWRDDEERPL